MVTATALVVKDVASAFQIGTVELEPLHPSEVLVELKATGICHTDAAVQHGKLPASYPIVLGHEGEDKKPPTRYIALCFD
jgi:aryl-alcohol dehydrogenase